MDENVKIKVDNLYKIFGPNPKKAFPLIEKGLERPEILEKTGNVVAVRGVSFEIKKKETFVIMGLSGSGKSTLIRCLNRLIDPTSGKIYIDGKNILEMDREELRESRRYMMSMVFQHFGLLPHRNVTNNVEFGLEIGGMEKEERNKKALDAIELVGLKGYEKSMPDELSGGMQQRVGLARALANNPEILLMDEAFSALDPLIRNQMQDELLELQAKMHKTIVFITHDLDEALKLGDRILILGPDGTSRQLGTPEEILSEPADDYVAKFVEKVDKTKVITVSSIMRKAPVMTIPKDGPGAASRTMEKNGISSIFVVDSDRYLKGMARIDDTVKLQKKKERDLEPILIRDIYTAYEDTPISDLLATALATKYPIVVIDKDYRYKGIVDRAAIINEVSDETEDTESPMHFSEMEEGISNQESDNGGK
ncbi:MAG: glycine betaine/L-proline ABC transporter ATP-binding protein [Spirochaetia bacterium]|nr:glycine betaine/L-proline ABC transporter ATP-binding protein [Spirochaetia bacterium]